MQNNRFDFFKYNSYILLFNDGSCIYTDSFCDYASDVDEVVCFWGFDKKLSPDEVLGNIPYLISSYKDCYGGKM